MKTRITVLIHCLEIYYSSDTYLGYEMYTLLTFSLILSVYFYSKWRIAKQKAELYV
jgi:hypothetical protein